MLSKLLLALSLAANLYFPAPAPDARQAHPIRLWVLRDYPVEGAPWSQVVAGGAWGRRVTMPTMAFLIDHPRAGLTLVDAGYGHRFDEFRSSFPGGLFYHLIHIDTAPPHRTIHDQLPALGIDPADVQRIVLTHMHFDHAGGTLDFPHARVIADQAEWKAWEHSPLTPGFLREHLRTHLDPVDLAAGKPYGILAHSQDLFGDGSVVLVSTPGHTPGHLGVFVNLDSGRRFFLAGDTAWVRENYRRPAPRGWLARTLVDAGSNDDSLLCLRHLDQVESDVWVVPSHDPAIEHALRVPPDHYE